MAVPQRKFREFVFQMLFSHDLNREIDQKIILSMVHQLQVTKKTMKQVYVRIQSIVEHLEEIDRQISKCSQHYDFNRISKVEKNILRLGVYELFYDEEIPSKVAFAEAVRLSRKFGTPEGGAFVNAILDAVYLANKQGLCLSNQS